MALLNLFCSIVMPQASSNVKQSSLVLVCIEIMLLTGILVQFNNCLKLVPRHWFFLLSEIICDKPNVLREQENQDSESSSSQQQPCFDDNKKDDEKLPKEEVEKVMENLGLFCSQESEKLKDFIGSNELSELFDEKEPSLEEVKLAFDVFDDNKDGFIDAKELRRVLCKLGLKEGAELENCRRMITRFDENGDGRIDFNEFVKCMENNFC